MKSLLRQLKWQFILLHKNNIISISFAVTLIFCVVLYSLRGVGNLDKVLVSLVLNDPSVIGYFFLALAIYTEMKNQVLPAIFATPVRIHQLLLSKCISISIIGVICSLGLVISVKGFDFHFYEYVMGSVGICIMSALLGLIMLTFTDEFLKFALLSIPVFLVFINIPMLQYLGGIELGLIKYFFPVQGSVDMIDYAVSGKEFNIWYGHLSILLLSPIFYFVAFRLFVKRIVHQ